MPEHKKNFYAVHKGRRPGIYSHWSGEGGAEEQVKGYTGARFRGFATRAAAEHFLNTGQALPETGTASRSTAEAPNVAAPNTAVKTMGSKAHKAEDASAPESGVVVIYTDGASTGNPGPGGYGAVLHSSGRRQELSGGFRCTTNNRMELTAVIVALRTLKQRSQVVVYTDSSYVANGVTLGWAKRWRARGWMRTASQRAENSDLWAGLLDLLEQHAVEFRWVKGHAGSPENERCDRMAVAAAHQKGLPPDPGYECR